ncbi:MAG: hypothetical protein ACRC0G_07165 [Fusobacteriaceae bacterium]
MDNKKYTLVEFKKMIEGLVSDGIDVADDERLESVKISMSNKYGIDVCIYSAYAQIIQTYIKSKIMSAYLRSIDASLFEINTAHSNTKFLQKAVRNMHEKIVMYHSNLILEKSKILLGGI